MATLCVAYNIATVGKKYLNVKKCYRKVFMKNILNFGEKKMMKSWRY